MTIEPVVVGVDGSDSAQHAVRWAAKEAAGRKAPLRLVHSYMEAAAYTSVPLPISVSGALAHLGQGWLRAAVAEAEKVAPDVDVTTELLRHNAADALIAESKSAQLMVLGSRGLGGFTELLVGSIAVAVAAHGHSPVVVVRGEQDDHSGKPVVVGLDHSSSSEAALEFAFEQAARLGVSLVAVHTWSDTLPPMAFSIVPPPINWFEIQEAAEQVLAQKLAGWAEKYPQVQVQRVVTRDRPAHSLIEEARAAQLLVVGSRGRGGMAGFLLGSTSQALLHHAPCPVAVVRPN